MILRLLLWSACDRTCPGCCNKDWDLDALPVVTEREIVFADMIILTGGEPMLSPGRVLSYVYYLRRVIPYQIPIILYTAKPADLPEMDLWLDGFTVTLHEQADVEPFLAVAGKLTGSLRVNVFKGVDAQHIPPQWQVKREIEWIKDCPLPTGELFRRIG